MSSQKKSPIKQFFKIFSSANPPSSAELKKKIMEIESDQRNFRRERERQNDEQNHLYRKAIQSEKDGREEEVLDLYRDIEDIELEKNGIAEDLMQLSLYKKFVKVMRREVARLERRNDSQSIQKLMDRFNSSKLPEMIVDAKIDKDTFNDELRGFIEDASHDQRRRRYQSEPGYLKFKESLGKIVQARGDHSPDETDINLLKENIKLSNKKSTEI